MTPQKLAVLLLFLISAFFAGAQEQSPATVKHVPLQSTSPASGKEMFTNYCASCHGVDGQGNGPAAPALKTAPANLTILSQQNGGKYPAMKVSSILRGDADLPAHGSKEMPVWGPLFRSVSGGHESQIQQRITNFTKYIESLQAK